MLKFYYHPFAAFCQKALVGLYEMGTAFESEIIDLSDPVQRGALEAVWPITKFPVLRDEARGVTVPESTLIIEYVVQHYPGGAALIPEDANAATRARLLDRVFDNYVAVPMQKIVADSLRPEGRADPEGVEQARALIRRAYAMLDRDLAGSGWAAGDSFTLADCAAAPALFYANIVVPFGDHENVAAYYERLLERPSVARVVDEARPYRALFPLQWPAEYR